ncbi:MAG: DUF3750 domain-containing protein [Gammaproteobacteria bacterium]|nr:DUF3750 domain-containing protein [Gammaproteobacteria bacterium]
MALAVLIVFLGPALASIAYRALTDQPHWRDASHAATGLAPSPAQAPEAVVQVYAARTWGLRGAVAVHTWIAVKRSNADHYVRYEVIGWALRRGGTAVVKRLGTPDAEWFSNPPQLLVDRRGPEVEALIDRIEAAVAAYPYAGEYRTLPGPNSNTFTAFVGRRVPELRLDLPPTAIGKDFLADGALIGRAPSGTGYQVSIWGLAGVLAALHEGVEVNLLGLAVGVRFKPLAIKLPGLGTWPRRATAENHNTSIRSTRSG